MTTTPAHRDTPRRLLLATDLSARCDRALDRAAQLAGEWQAELVALNVLDPTASPDQTLAWIRGAGDDVLLHAARQQLARDLAAVDIPATLRLVRSEDAPATIRETAASTQSGLVVTAESCNPPLGRLFPGSTVANLARSLLQPLLVVRNRVTGPYRRILVTSDFSGPSRHALLTTLRLFPGRELVLYHARALAMSGLSDALSQAGVGGAAGKAECAAFIAATPLPEAAKLRPVVECGAVESTLTRYVREHEIDLVVMGSQGRSGLMGLLLGSTAARLLDWLPCDTLLLRAPPGAA